MSARTPYKALQKRAMARGIPANQTDVKLERQLAEEDVGSQLFSDDEGSNDVVGEAVRWRHWQTG